MFDKLFGRNKSHETVDINRRFNLIGRVGQGSMSKVWKATDLRTGKTVALKVLDKEKTARYEARFQGLKKPNEGEVAMTLHHPNIVKTLEFGWTIEDEMYLVMEYVEGVGLSLLVDLQNEEMKRYRIRYMIQIGEALQYFHQQNWIHRDICPRNVMVAEDKQIKLIDFGLVVPNTAEFRKPGNRTGTASYMAPELIKRQTTDHRIDIFSYAVTCYEMYAKRGPWDAAMTIDAVLQHINKPPLELATVVPKIDKRIASTIMKGLATNPDDRWQQVSDMVSEFRQAEIRLVQAARDSAARKSSDSGSEDGSVAPSAGTSSKASAKSAGKAIAPASKSSRDDSPAPRPKKKKSAE